MKVKSSVFTDTNLYSLSGRMEAEMELLLNSNRVIVSTFSGVNESGIGSIKFYGVIFYREAEN